MSLSPFSAKLSKGLHCEPTTPTPLRKPVSKAIAALLHVLQHLEVSTTNSISFTTLDLDPLSLPPLFSWTLPCP